VPSRLTPSDWLDASCKINYTIRHGPARGRINFRDGRIGSRCRASPPPFPPGTAGFLYAHTVPGHPAAGAVRMRLVPTRDPTHFATGTDLLLPNGLPWAAPFPVLARAQKNRPLRECLVREGLVDAKDVARWADLPIDGRVQVVHGPDTAFFIDFAECSGVNLHVTHGTHVEWTKLQNFACVKPLGGAKSTYPLWSGTCPPGVAYYTWRS
jgi:hypothetical protein